MDSHVEEVHPRYSTALQLFVNDLENGKYVNSLMYRHALKRMRNSHDAHDFVQHFVLHESHTLARSSLDFDERTVPAEHDGLRRFFTYVIPRRVIDYAIKQRGLRRKTHEYFVDLDFFERFSQDNNPLEEVINKEAETLIHSFVKLLPPQQQKIFTFHYLEEKTDREIAECLSISCSSVGTALHQVRKKLKGKMSGYYR